MKAPKSKNEIQSPGKLKLLNPERKPLTIQKYRELSGLHDLSDEEAEKAVESIRLLAKILFEFINQNKHT